ncbi:hypothetical protein BU15DRAFT_76096 [Melanogaster broomeanus]|nr:hypothetical protein BU15DRAFT_76096 [Melanogaster broomeanus]
MPPVKKRVKKPNSKADDKVRASGSTLKPCLDMPLEMLMEARILAHIFQFLDPLDLLHLSRTSKGLRAFLLNRDKSLTCWKIAINNVGLPPCPDYISEPAYTHLAFVPLCHGCLTPCHTIKWELRLRCCQNCLPAMTITSPPSEDHRRCLTKSYRYLPSASQQYIAYDDGLAIYLSSFNVTYSWSDWEKLPSGHLTVEALDHWTALAERVKQHSSLCRDWEHKIRKSRADLYRGIFNERRNEYGSVPMLYSVHLLTKLRILRRLQRQGWKRLLDHLDSGPSSIFGRLPQVRKLEPLTHAEWTEICPQLLHYLRQHKAERIKRQYSSAVHERFHLLSKVIEHNQELVNDISLKVRPSRIDISLLPRVQKIIERRTNIELTMRALTRAIKPVLPKLIQEWSTNAVDEVKKLAREQLGLSSRVNPSRHIAVVFQCETCHKMLRFDQALTHPHLSVDPTLSYCSSSTRKIYDEAAEGSSAYEQLARVYFRCLPRDCSVLRADATSFRRISTLVTMLGYNPATVAYDDPRLSDVKVTCDSCRQSRRTVMDFPTADENSSLRALAGHTLTPNRLKSLGYNTRELLDHLDNGPSSNFGRLPQVKKLEPLTPGEWTEIRPQLVDYLRQHKAERIEEQYPGTFHERFCLLSTALHLDKQRSNGTSLKVRPHEIDICLFPAVRKVIERLRFEYTTRSFAPVLPKLIRKWSVNSVKEVKRVAREQLGLSSEVDPSRHISVVFQCKTCRTMLRFDEALSHSHLYDSTLGYSNRSSTQKNYDEAPEVLLSSYEQLARAHYKCLPWNCSVLRADTTSFHRINTLVTMLGYDPATVTYDDPRLSDVAVTCDSCHRSRRTVMDIQAASDHCITAHLRAPEMLGWTRVVETV